MRIATKTFVTSVSMGVLAISYAVGTQVSADAGFSSNTASTDTTASNTAGANPAATPSASASSAPPASTSTTASGSKKKTSSTSSTKTTAASTTKKKKTSSSSSSTPAPSASSGSGSTGSGSSGSGSGSSTASVTNTSASISYQFGTVKISVTKDASGQITDITVPNQWYTRVPNGTEAYLIAAAKQANGSNFANVSHATYTTKAFKAALDSALAKF